MSVSLVVRPSAWPVPVSAQRIRTFFVSRSEVATEQLGVLAARQICQTLAAAPAPAAGRARVSQRGRLGRAARGQRQADRGRTWNQCEVVVTQACRPHLMPYLKKEGSDEKVAVVTCAVIRRISTTS